jgi:hypothetical protein
MPGYKVFTSRSYQRSIHDPGPRKWEIHDIRVDSSYSYAGTKFLRDAQSMQAEIP